MKGKSPRILLASGIFFPDVGGPATHVRKLAEYFTGLGWPVTVVAFGDWQGKEPYRVRRISRRQPKSCSWIRYAWAIAREAPRHDLIYAFDLTTAGVPSALSARIFAKPFMLRIGGDPIWERIAERGERSLPMRHYYEQGLFRIDRPLLFRTISAVVRSADRVITYSDFLTGIYRTYYGVPLEKMRIIKNPLPVRHISALENATTTFIFAGRFVSYKNLSRVIRVFSRIAAKHPRARLLLIGDGPEEGALRKEAEKLNDRVLFLKKMDQQELFTRIKESSVALAPALTEFNPNFVLEALALGKPALISRDNGLSIQLPPEFQFDPLDDASIEQAMERLLEPENYTEAFAFVRQLPTSPTWEEVIREHERYVRELTGL